MHKYFTLDSTAAMKSSGLNYTLALIMTLFS